jgi:protein-S-isoprenylcysteine O-methyltransferase Ste14
MKKITEKLIRYRSTVGIIALILLLVMSDPSPSSISIGFFIMMAGMIFRFWTSGHINKDAQLATNGPYELTRNPLYFGNFVLGLGIAIAGNTVVTYLIFFIYYLMFFPFLMVIEHRRLKKRFGKEYEEWAKKSHSFIPKLKFKINSGFNISFYMKNKEYRVLYFSLFIIVLLIFKYLYVIKVG